ncbi:hypothetical protein Dsin_026173 [Dipteronia sinensis]|uniref:Uncharacterized protein n=1 Tax=Dipteronia sinensis TaxID=43782 RepID=A0AAD9ZYR9_9ROSI|nr:hypothetical protein Dsin_026173 [Dipteronia sinensis]
MVEPPPPPSSSRLITKDVDGKLVDNAVGFLQMVGISSNIPENMSTKDFYSHIVGSHLKVHQIQRGRVTCLFSVKPAVVSILNSRNSGRCAILVMLPSSTCLSPSYEASIVNIELAK